MGVLKDFIIASIAFSAIIIGVSVWAADVADLSGVHVANMSQLSTVNNVRNLSIEMQNSFQQQSIQGSWLDMPFTILGGIWSFLKLAFTSVGNIFTSVFSSMATYFMLPAWVFPLVLLAIIVTIGFAIMSATTKWQL